MKHFTVYKAAWGSDSRHCVEGPGNGFGFYAGTLWPHLRFDSERDAAAAAELCNTAYSQGYERALHDLRTALGVAKP